MVRNNMLSARNRSYTIMNQETPKRTKKLKHLTQDYSILQPAFATRQV